MKLYIIVKTAILFTAAETVFAGNALLDQYIREGLNGNLSLSSEKINGETALASQKEAGSNFLPRLSFQARYTRAFGGLSIDLPVGELLNPLYKHLDPSFPGVNDYPLTLIPEKYQETKLQLVQPLFSPATVANFQMNRHLAEAQNASLNAAANILIRDIRICYYKCLQARDAVSIHEAAVKRSGNQLHSARRLADAGMLGTAALSSAVADSAASQADYRQARSDYDIAAKALNLLLNRNLSGGIPLEKPDSLTVKNMLLPDTAGVSWYESEAVKNRQELSALKESRSASGYYTRMEKSAWYPAVNAAVEAGITGTRYEINEQSEFFNASLLLSWDLFSGFSKLHKVRKAKLAEKQLETRYADTEAKIVFEVQKAYDELVMIRENYKAAVLKCDAAEKNYRSVLKSYEQGQISSTEMTNAAAALTSANAAKSITLYNIFIKDAELRYAASLDNAGHYLSGLTEENP